MGARQLAMALVALTLFIAAGAAGYAIRAMTSPVVATAAPPMAKAATTSGNLAGDRWWPDQKPAAGSSLAGNAWWNDMP